MNKAKEIMRKLESEGFQAFIVGGAVRDTLLGLEPKDFDVATNATPDQIGKLFPNSLFVGESFGVRLVDGVEVATFRVDKNCDGRHCEVDFVTTIEEDLARRDLTINAMAMDLKGNLVDPFGGKEDLEAGLVRFVGNPRERLEEDLLRALRAVRFASRFGFELEEESLKAVQEVSSLVPNKVSPERVLAEFMKV